MQKFEVGQKVKVINDANQGFPVGTIGVVMVVNTDDYEVWNLDHTDYFWHTHRCLELALDLERDYPEFNDKIITYIFSDGERHKVKVLGCSYDIGVTFVAPDDDKDMWLCYHGPLSPIRKKGDRDDQRAIALWPEKFKLVVDMIQAGTFEMIKIYDLNESANSYTSTNTNGAICAFSM